MYTEITNYMHSVTWETLVKVFANKFRWVELCFQNKGQHFQHLLWLWWVSLKIYLFLLTWLELRERKLHSSPMFFLLRRRLYCSARYSTTNLTAVASEKTSRCASSLLTHCIRDLCMTSHSGLRIFGWTSCDSELLSKHSLTHWKQSSL